MTFLPYSARNKDLQDNLERHIYGEVTYEEKGSTIKVAGTESNDEEVMVMNVGGSHFKLKKDTDAEVFLIASSSDTTMKAAILTIPVDKQRRWPEDEGGIQHPTDEEFALHFSDKLAHLTKNKFAVGEKGEFEVKGDAVYIRAKKIIFDGELHVTKLIKTPQVTTGPESPPSFEGNKQEAKKSSGGGGGSQPTQIELDFGNAE